MLEDDPSKRGLQSLLTGFPAKSPISSGTLVQMIVMLF